MKFQAVLAAAVSAIALTSTAAQASVSITHNQTAFENAGTITQSFDFDGFGSGFSFPGDPYTVGDVTFTTTNNLIVGAGLYGAGRNTIANNFWTPLNGSVGGSHDLFGFNLALGGQFGQVDITVTTNLGSYDFTNVPVNYNDGGFTFQGFQADAGESFTGFSVSSLYGPGSLPQATDFRLGTSGDTGGVPEPATWGLMILGFAGVGSTLRSRRRALAA